MAGKIEAKLKELNLTLPAPGAPGGDFLGMMLPLVLIFVVFYFLLIRPQQKRMKEHKAKIDAIRRGDRVVARNHED